MRILVLDDMEERHELFHPLHKSNKNIVIHTYRYEDCIMELKSTPDAFDAIFLDHDLSLEAIMCDPNTIEEKTGTDVAKWIASNMDPETCGTIICHSMNPHGRLNMFKILYEAGFQAVNLPFVHLNIVLNTL